ncbi:hypothetical protein Fcan01_13131 [Folsomia candida]|uniref:Protein sleepless n=1 Tax=Folsomia candida TaxID=158441 RepID=A0A226E3K1_FOLCA|nr:hypothetical protein Fcan01_13131 [Folsomia candida]
MHGKISHGSIEFEYNYFKPSSSLKCFHCLERPKSTEKHLSCAYFDMSSKFHKECTHSTFCMKRTALYQLHNGSYVTIYVHKCADQSHRTMVQDKNGDWNWANLLRFDLYNEGCARQHHSPSLLTTETSHCFCGSDFCNRSSLPASSNKSLVLVSAVITFLAIFAYS